MRGSAREADLSVVEEIPFSGHPLIRGTHQTTVEITTESHLTPQGDCIVGVRAAKGLAALSPSTKAAIRTDGAKVKLTIFSPWGSYSFSARGSRDLTLESPTDIVVRRSSFICGRTLAIGADSAARDLPRPLVSSLRTSGATGLLRIVVEN